jgi:hypothetical protein
MYNRVGPGVLVLHLGGMKREWRWDRMSLYRRPEPGLTYPMMTLSAPRGVTRIGGAKVYAAKLATAGWSDTSYGAIGGAYFLLQPLNGYISTWGGVRKRVQLTR